MVISIHQPTYIPWLGFFDKVSRSDVFIFLDTVQLETNSFSYRNKIKTAQGANWLTIPLKLKGHTSKLINEILIDNSQAWKQKHLKSIFYNYKKSINFENLYPKLINLYKEEFILFSDLAYNHLIFWLNELKIKTKIIKSSNLNINSKKSELILDICKYFQAKKYISGSLGVNYLIQEDFNMNKIEIEYQDFKHPIYNQLFGNFIPNLSIVDFLMNNRLDNET